MQQERFIYLFNRYFLKSASSKEKEDFFNLVDSNQYDDLLKELIDSQYKEFVPHNNILTTEKEAEILSSILKAKQITAPLKINKSKNYLVRYAVAATILCVLSIGLYFYRFQKNKSENEIAASKILPGGNKAQLVLASGKIILLDTVKNGAFAIEDGVEITKTADGQLIYAVKNNNSPIKNALNTIETPKGGQYKVILPDGTNVWLNAATSLKYPSNFSGKRREVYLTGEAYFEVAKNKDKAFVVSTKAQFVEVLGTHFNISAYADDETQTTTLLEGSVKTANKTKQFVLKSGQQSIFNLKNEDFLLSNADVESVVAWKNGDFIFKDEDLSSLMRKVERWYDVEVVFDKNINPETIKIGGWVSRSKNLSAIAKIIESITDLDLNIEGRRITVSK